MVGKMRQADLREEFLDCLCMISRDEFELTTRGMRAGREERDRICRRCAKGLFVVLPRGYGH